MKIRCPPTRTWVSGGCIVFDASDYISVWAMQLQRVRVLLSLSLSLLLLLLLFQRPPMTERSI